MDKPSEQQITVWHRRLFRTAQRMTGNPEDAADLTQEAICRAWAKWDQYDGRCQPTTWVYRILINCIHDWVRRTGVRQRLAADATDLFDVPAKNPAPDAAVGAEERDSIIRQAIANLSPLLRRPFIAAVLDGYSYQEVAELLALPEGTVAYRIHRARQEIADAVRKTLADTET